MLESKIKELFNLSEVSQEIIDKINEIESDGYIFTDLFNETMQTRNSTVGSHGYFDPLMFYKMCGDKYTIATFENEDGQKRYCILNNKKELINKAYSRLKWERTEGLSDARIEANNVMIDELKKHGIELEEHEAYELFAEHYFDNIDTSNPRNVAENLVDNLIDEITNFIKYLQRYQADNEIIIAHELYNCGKDRQRDTMYFISPIFRQGFNSKEQDYIVQLAQEKIFSTIAKSLLDKGEILTAEQAYTFGVEQEALDALIKKVKEEPDSSKDLTRKYLRFTQLSFRDLTRNTNVHPSLVDIVEKAIKENPENLNPKRVNSDLQKISQRLHKSLTNFTTLSPDKINEVMGKILTEYMIGDFEHGKSYDQMLYMVSIRPRPLSIERLSEFYDNINEYLEDKDKLPKQLLTKIVEFKIKDLSKQLADVLKDESLSVEEKLVKAKEIKENFDDDELVLGGMTRGEIEEKSAEIFGDLIPRQYQIISNETFIEQYSINIDGKKIIFDIPQFEELINLQFNLNKEIYELAMQELYEQSPYIYMKKTNTNSHEQDLQINLSNGMCVDLFLMSECKERYDETISQEQAEINAELTIGHHKYIRYMEPCNSTQIGNRTLSFGINPWSIGGNYIITLFDNEKEICITGTSLSHPKTETQKQINEIVNLGLKYPEEFWKLFDSISKSISDDIKEPIEYNFAKRLREQINKNWDQINDSLDSKITNKKAISSSMTSNDNLSQEVNNEEIK